MTAGALGAVLADSSGPARLVPTTPVTGDTCGAGDRFAATLTAVRAGGGSRLDAVQAAVADARAWVAGSTAVAGPAVAPIQGAPGAVQEAHARGGVVVAAGGCFDLLHAGHVELLEAARRLGDCLVVLVNSDASIRRLKGPSRPLNAERDRARVLRSLACVDDVVLFDEDTPCDALARVRPHLFVKGADYAGTELPEEPVLAAWGGRVVLLPLMAGRSTSRLIDLARERASA
jgi:rfaE bifunctional protein nucleotidyltransferase chain/domain